MYGLFHKFLTLIFARYLPYILYKTMIGILNFKWMNEWMKKRWKGIIWLILFFVFTQVIYSIYILHFLVSLLQLQTFLTNSLNQEPLKCLCTISNWLCIFEIRSTLWNKHAFIHKAQIENGKNKINVHVSFTIIDVFSKFFINKIILYWYRTLILPIMRKQALSDIL